MSPPAPPPRSRRPSLSAPAFDTDQDTALLNLYESLEISPWTNEFLKGGKVDGEMERMYWDQEAKYQRPALKFLVDFWLAFNCLELLIDLHPTFFDVVTPKVVKMRRFDDAVFLVAGLRGAVCFMLGWVRGSGFLEQKNFTVEKKWKLVSLGHCFWG